jgi:hypothetical protein
MISKYQKIIDQLTTSDIVTLVGQFGVPETSIKYYNNQLIMPTCCHNEIISNAKHKLYYYEGSKKFNCFTCCGSLDPYEFIVQAYRTRGIKYSKANALIILEKIIQERLKDGFAIVTPPSVQPIEVEKDWHNSLTEYNSSVMDCFSKNKKYLRVWEKEGISFTTMEKFGIKFDMIRNRMVIPIYSDKNIFVGAKVRNFNPEEIENGRKYMPLIHNNEIYSYDKGKILYGLNLNKSIIKKAKRVIIFESEKSTLMYDSMFVGNRAVSIGGSNVSVYQVELLKQLDVETIVLALDNDYSLLPDENGAYDKFFGLLKMLKEANKLMGKGFQIEIVYDWGQEYLDNKDAPIDKGRDIWNKLYRARKNFNELAQEYLKKGENNERTKVEIEDF